MLNPATPVESLNYVLDKVDMILLMSVNPGFGGQKFIPGVLRKIREVRALADRHFEETGHAIRVEVDGGVKTDNIGEIAAPALTPLWRDPRSSAASRRKAIAR